MDILPYTKATTLEIIRLSTTSPLTAPHETTCDTELFGYKIPKGTEVSRVRLRLVSFSDNRVHSQKFNDTFTWMAILFYLYIHYRSFLIIYRFGEINGQ